jgi:hypothetical protein
MRQPKTAKPKAKFLQPCIICKELPTRVVVDGVLITKFTCGHAQVVNE